MHFFSHRKDPRSCFIRLYLGGISDSAASSWEFPLCHHFLAVPELWQEPFIFLHLGLQLHTLHVYVCVVSGMYCRGESWRVVCRRNCQQAEGEISAACPRQMLSSLTDQNTADLHQRGKGDVTCYGQLYLWHLTTCIAFEPQVKYDISDPKLQIDKWQRLCTSLKLAETQVPPPQLINMHCPC